MVGIVFGMPSFASSAGSSSAASASASNSITPEADKALAMLFENKDFLTTLRKASVPELPPSKVMVMEALWGLLNSNSNSSITEADVERSIRIAGGSAADSTALWAVMDPDKEGSINAAKYVKIDYLAVAVQAMYSDIKADVEVLRQEQALEDARGTSGTVLDYATPIDPGFIDFFI